MEFCVKCGKNVDQLDDFSGWCNSCTPVSSSDIKERWLKQYADQLEELLQQGYSFRSAKRIVYDNIRPTCRVCNEPIFHGRKEVKFCTRTTKCKTARRRYRTLREGAMRLPAQIALEQTLRELGKET